MYRILIVDDEYWVGRWLTDVLQKHMPEAEIIGVCQDGEEALEFLGETPADILITDINMPVVNGLDLIRATGTWKQIPKAIVISGYDEFEYARQAIELDVISYLIKPLEKEPLFAAIEKAVAEIEKERLREHHDQAGYYAESENLLMEFFQSPREYPDRTLEAFFDVKGIRNRYYLIGMIQDTRMETPKILKEDLRRKLELACHGRQVFLFMRNPYTWTFLIAGIEKAEGFFLDEPVLFQVLKNCFYGFSTLHNDLKDLRMAELEARNAILAKLGRKEGDNGSGIFLTDINDKLISAIRAGDKDLVLTCSREAEEVFLKMPYDLTNCLNFYFVLTGDVVKMLADAYKTQKKDSLLKLIDEGYGFSAQIRDFYSISAICRRFEAYAFDVINCLDDVGPLSVGEVVWRVERTIRERYATDLNLGSIADEFGINPSYFSKKFKEETGINFVDYLARVRIEQAQVLLKHTELSIAGISRKVGFNDPKYFSKVFQALTGVKPSDYRNWAKEVQE